MKKLIVFSVVFALVAGGLFAADISVNVFGGIKVLQGSNVPGITEASADKAYKAGQAMAQDMIDNPTDPKYAGKSADELAAMVAATMLDLLEEGPVNPTFGGQMNRLRMEASGGGDDFGGWIRIDNGSSSTFNGTAWWKPIDQLRLTFGRNPDGVFGKDNGAAGWGFYAMPSEIDIVTPGNVWGGGYHHKGVYRDAFFGGYEINGLALEVMPADIFNLVIGVPFFAGGEGEDILQKMIIQGNLNLDFGQIALTYEGDGGPGVIDPDNKFSAMGKFYLNFELSAVENLGLNFGVGFPLPATYKSASVQDDIAVGLGVTYAVSDAFGFKIRLLTEFGGQKLNADGKAVFQSPFHLGADLLPYYVLSDNLAIFLGLGMSYKAEDMTFNSLKADGASVGNLKPIKDTSAFGWHVNPYVRVGAEWGPTFYAGVKIWSDGGAEKESPLYKTTGGAKGTKYVPVNYEIPIGIIVSF